MDRLSTIWHWITTTRYTRSIERELEYLRRENHALRDSLLGVAGIPALGPKIQAEAEGRTETARGYPQKVIRRPTMHAWLREKEFEEAKRRSDEVRREQKELVQEMKSMERGTEGSGN